MTIKSTDFDMIDFLGPCHYLYNVLCVTVNFMNRCELVCTFLSCSSLVITMKNKLIKPRGINHFLISFLSENFTVDFGQTKKIILG